MILITRDIKSSLNIKNKLNSILHIKEDQIFIENLFRILYLFPKPKINFIKLDYIIATSNNILKFLHKNINLIKKYKVKIITSSNLLYKNLKKFKINNNIIYIPNKAYNIKKYLISNYNLMQNKNILYLSSNIVTYDFTLLNKYGFNIVRQKSYLLRYKKTLSDKLLLYIKHNYIKEIWLYSLHNLHILYFLVKKYNLFNYIKYIKFCCFSNNIMQMVNLLKNNDSRFNPIISKIQYGFNDG